MLNSVQSMSKTNLTTYRIVIWTAPRTALNGRDLFGDREQLAPFNAVARRLGAALFSVCRIGRRCPVRLTHNDSSTMEAIPLEFRL
jgi:hypothetical protein